MAFGNQSFGNGGLHRPQADINVTPLVDVMLVLLIVFMITAPMLATGLKVELPQAKAAQPINPKDPIVVSVTREGKVAIGQDEMDVASLIDALIVKAEGDMTRVIQVRADKDASYGDIVGVIDQLATNGMTHIALISDRKATAPAHDMAATASIDHSPPVTAAAR